MIYFYAKEQLLLAPLKYLTSSFLCTFFIYRCFLKPPVKCHGLDLLYNYVKIEFLKKAFETKKK